MATRIATVEQAEQRLRDIRIEQARQTQFLGVRFGVFSKLKELAREERRVQARLSALQLQWRCKGDKPT